MLGEVRRKEGEEGRGMQERRAHVQQAGAGMKVVLGEGVGEEVRGLVSGVAGGRVVMLVSSFSCSCTTVVDGLTSGWGFVQKIDPDESVVLAGVEETDLAGLASTISDTEPRYSFFRYTHAMDGTEENSSVVFIYTCPPASKVKERMVYASFKKMVMDAASQAGGFEVAKKVSWMIFL